MIIILTAFSLALFRKTKGLDVAGLEVQLQLFLSQGREAGSVGMHFGDHRELALGPFQESCTAAVEGQEAGILRRRRAA